MEWKKAEPVGNNGIFSPNFASIKKVKEKI